MNYALTKREFQVADLIHQGLIEKEIASALFLSHGTVHTYKKRLCKKLNARNIADITRIFILYLEKPQNIVMMILALSLQVLCMFVDASEIASCKGEGCGVYSRNCFKVIWQNT